MPAIVVQASTSTNVAARQHSSQIAAGKMVQSIGCSDPLACLSSHSIQPGCCSLCSSPAAAQVPGLLQPALPPAWWEAKYGTQLAVTSGARCKHAETMVGSRCALSQLTGGAGSSEVLLTGEGLCKSRLAATGVLEGLAHLAWTMECLLAAHLQCEPQGARLTWRGIQAAVSQPLVTCRQPTEQALAWQHEHSAQPSSHFGSHCCFRDC